MYLANKVLRKDYGWIECVEKRDCKNLDEIKRYYYRIGIILFVSYLLGTNDIHCENIVADGEFPIIVDLENITSMNVIEKRADINNSTELKLKESVVNSGLLPYFWKNADLSALSRGNSIKMPFKIPVVKELGTYNMHIEYEHKIIKCTSNRATLKGKFILPNKFENEILKGFGNSYRFMLDNKEKIKKYLDNLQDVRGRYLVENTQKYVMLLYSSYHPDVMKNAADREFLLNFLWKRRNCKSNIDCRIVDAEIYDLLHNDIPYFYFYMNKTDLFDSRNYKIPNCFQEIPIKRLYKRLEAMDNKDMICEKSFIHLLLSIQGEENLEKWPKFHDLRRAIEKNNINSNREMVNKAENIADKLLEEAQYSEDRNCINWFQPNIVGNQFGNVRIQICGKYIYNGISGILIFFSILNIFSLQKKYINVCEKLERQLLIYTDKIRKNITNAQSGNSGIYNGEGSIVYTYLILFQLSKNYRFLEYAEKHAEIVIRLAKKDENNDLMSGIAGAIVVLCYLYQLSNKIIYLIEAEKIAIKLMHNSVIMDGGIGWKQADGETPLLGMVHGNSGIMIALAQLYKYTNNKMYYINMIRAIDYERNNYNCNTGDWIDYRADKNRRGISPAAWCHGAGGILLSRILLTDLKLKPEDRVEINKDIEKAYLYLEKNKLRKELCICHGECGNLLIKSLCKKKGYNFSLKEKEETHMEDIILTKEWYNPGLMDGYTGIGYYFLMQIPNISNYIFLSNIF